VLQKFGFDESVLEEGHHRCHCSDCTDRRQEADVDFRRGDYPYVLPTAFAKFAIKLNATQVGPVV
jgi:hypothetical protein